MDKNCNVDEPYWRVARRGITLLLNNRQQEANALFCSRPDCIFLHAGYSISVFLDALMTYEQDKLELAQQVLHDVERRCSATSGGWFRAHSGPLGRQDYVQQLEAQIVTADSYMCLSALIFLQQDFTSFLRSAWVIHKAWKQYQHVYNEILGLYKDIVGELPNMDITTDDEDENEESDLDSVFKAASVNEEEARSPVNRNGYIVKSSTTTFDTIVRENDDASQPAMRTSRSLHSALYKYTHSGLTAIASNILYISSTLNPLQLLGVRRAAIDAPTITRLMHAVAFGMGILQLAISFLPSAVLRFTHFFGFQANRMIGLKKLMYARNGTDMRAPLATLALLWYHTIVRPFFALDGNRVAAGASVSAMLIESAMPEYEHSSIFLYFKGRAERLKRNIPAAIDAFQQSINNTNRREILILSEHEVGWCHLVDLNFPAATTRFLAMRTRSRWTRHIYSYLTLLSAASSSDLGNLNNLSEYVNMCRIKLSRTQFDVFLTRRFNACPATLSGFMHRSPLIWKLFLYELLYLWNTMPCCSDSALRTIISECQEIGSTPEGDSFAALSNLIHGSAACVLRDYGTAIEQFRQCLAIRASLPTHADDAHISAFASCELGHLLVRTPETRSEGIRRLQHVRHFKHYDFDGRLIIRVNAILKGLQ